MVTDRVKYTYKTVDNEVDFTIYIRVTGDTYKIIQLKTNV